MVDPNGRSPWLINRGDPPFISHEWPFGRGPTTRSLGNLLTRSLGNKSWDDPPSIFFFFLVGIFGILDLHPKFQKSNGHT